MTRIVAVFGATGAQGSSVVNSLLADETFTPRAKAHTMSFLEVSHGVEVVQADLDDKESIKTAIAGSEGVFGVTNAGDPAGLAKGPGFEIDQGKNLVDACKETSVKLLIWSSLPSISKLSNGKYPNILATEHKAIVDEYLRASGVPHAILHTGVFAENIYRQHLVKVGATYKFTTYRTPATSLKPMVWIGRDLGPSVLALLKNYQDINHAKEVLSQTFHVVSQVISFGDLVQITQEVLGKPVVYESIQSGMPAADELADFFEEFDYSEMVKPDPRLVALGATFSTMQQFVKEEIRPRYV